MQADKALAIVLRVVDFSETSCVVTLFTREFGKVRGLAKGARRLKGPFESALDLLSLCRIVFLRKSSDALDLLTEAKLEWRFRPRNRDLSRLYAAYYMAELLNDLTHDGDPHAELFDATLRGLRELASDSVATSWCVLRYELALVRILGHLPSLDRCVECGTMLGESKRVHFGVLAGGVLCARCRPGKRHVVNISDESLLIMRDLSSDTERGHEAVGRACLGELRGVLNRYLAHLMGHRPRMHAYLGFLAE